MRRAAAWGLAVAVTVVSGYLLRLTVVTVVTVSRVTRGLRLGHQSAAMLLEDFSIVERITAAEAYINAAGSPRHVGEPALGATRPADPRCGMNGRLQESRL
jgi:hypothetical protein